MEEIDFKEIRWFAKFMLVAIVVVCILLNLMGAKEENDKETLQHDSSAIELTSAENETITVPGFSKIRFKAGTTIQSILFSNPAGNSAEMAVKFLVDGKIIYESGLISPGQCVNEIEISKVFKAGNYDCIVEYQFYKDEVQLNGARNKCELEVY